MAADMTGIVVGVDGSADSLRALRWAVDEAQIRGSDVTVLGAYEAIPVRAAWMPDTDYVELPVETLENHQSALEGLIDKTLAEWGVERPAGLTVRASLGGARELLLKAGETADLVVVGSRGASAVGRLLLGSVSSALAHNATCPVVVVPPVSQA